MIRELIFNLQVIKAFLRNIKTRTFIKIRFYKSFTILDFNLHSYNRKLTTNPLVLLYHINHIISVFNLHNILYLNTFHHNNHSKINMGITLKLCKLTLLEILTMRILGMIKSLTNSLAKFSHVKDIKILTILSHNNLWRVYFPHNQL